MSSSDRFDAPRGLRPDQPNIVYGFVDADTGEERAVKLHRGGEGRPGPSPGDVTPLEAVPDRLDRRLPEVEIPGRRGLQQDDCGDDFPAFGCSSCGSPLYVGRTCASPLCRRCWAASVKESTISLAARLESMRKLMYSRNNGRKDIDFNEVFASLPSFLVGRDDALDTALLVLKELLRANWGVEDFVWIYHPWRIKKEYRKDLYEHGGEPGEGDMTWKDVMAQPDWEEYVYFAPHFHVFLPAPRRSFDYNIVPAVQEQSGWSFRRNEKRDSHVSIEDLEHLVKRITYCLSHVGVEPDATADGKTEKLSGYKGFRDLDYVQDEAVEQVSAAFFDNAYDLLGVPFGRADRCNEEVPAGEGGGARARAADTSVGFGGREHADTSVGSGRGPTMRAMADGGQFIQGAGVPGLGVTYGEPDVDEDELVDDDQETEICGGELVPIWEAAELLKDDDWRLDAAHADGLERAVKAWKRAKLDREDLPEYDGAVPPPSRSFLE